MTDAKATQAKGADTVGSIYYAYSDETMEYSDPKRLVADYKDAVDVYGINAVSACVLTKNIEQAIKLGYSICEIRAGEYSYCVDKEHYEELARRHGVSSQKLGEAIVDPEELYMRIQQRKQQDVAEQPAAEMEV